MTAAGVADTSAAAHSAEFTYFPFYFTPESLPTH